MFSQLGEFVKNMGETINSKTTLVRKKAIKVRPKQNFFICPTDMLAAINLPDKICFFEDLGVHPPYPPAVSPLLVMVGSSYLIYGRNPE